jgi:thioredoxin
MKNLFIYSLILLAVASCNSSSRTQKLKAQEFSVKLNETEKPILLDARTAEEYNEEHLKDAIVIDFENDNFETEIAKLDKSKPVFVYSNRGGRSAKAFMTLKKAGFSPVYELRGGIDSWKINDNPVVAGNKVKSINNGPKIVDFATALKGDKLVLVDFTATWCGPCQKMKPSIHKLRDEMYKDIVITEVDVDARRDLSSKYRIEAMPTLVFFKDGKETSRSVGYLREAQLRSLIAKELDQ